MKMNDHESKGPEVTPHVSKIKSRKYTWISEEYILILHAYFAAALCTRYEDPTSYAYNLEKKSK